MVLFRGKKKVQFRGIGSGRGHPQLRMLQLWVASSQAKRTLRLRSPQLVGANLPEESDAFPFSATEGSWISFLIMSSFQEPFSFGTDFDDRAYSCSRRAFGLHVAPSLLQFHHLSAFPDRFSQPLPVESRLFFEDLAGAHPFLRNSNIVPYKAKRRC